MIFPLATTMHFTAAHDLSSMLAKQFPFTYSRILSPYLTQSRNSVVCLRSDCSSILQLCVRPALRARSRTLVTFIPPTISSIPLSKKWTPRFSLNFWTLRDCTILLTSGPFMSQTATSKSRWHDSGQCRPACLHGSRRDRPMIGLCKSFIIIA